MHTPGDGIDQVLPDRPHKRRRKKVDKLLKLSDAAMKKNIETVLHTIKNQVPHRIFQEVEENILKPFYINQNYCAAFLYSLALLGFY